MKQATDFRMDGYYGTIEASGYWSQSQGHYDINTSSILTRLIQEAGRYCERFASDLFISWSSVEERIRDIDDGENDTFLFGFRQDGVDHNDFVLCRAENERCYGSFEHNYRSLWRLDLSAAGNELTMTLGRVF